MKNYSKDVKSEWNYINLNFRHIFTAFALHLGNGIRFNLIPFYHYQNFSSHHHRYWNCHCYHCNHRSNLNYYPNSSYVLILPPDHVSPQLSFSPSHHFPSVRPLSLSIPYQTSLIFAFIFLSTLNLFVYLILNLCLDLCTSYSRMLLHLFIRLECPVILRSHQISLTVALVFPLMQEQLGSGVVVPATVLAGEAVSVWEQNVLMHSKDGGVWPDFQILLCWRCKQSASWHLEKSFQIVTRNHTIWDLYTKRCRYT